jgi:hypothetical protein
MLPTDTPDIGWLTFARQKIADNSGQAVYKEFFKRFSGTTDDKGAAVRETMRALEELWEQDQLVAGYLMAMLLPDASSAYRHDVWDAIWLYLEDATNVDLADALERATRRRGTRNKDSKFSRVVLRIRTRNAHGG